MPWNRKRIEGPSRHCLEYNEQHLEAAVNSVNTGAMSYRESSQSLSIGKMMIYRKVNNICQGAVGSPPVLNEEEERLVDKLSKAAEWGFPLDFHDLRLIIKSRSGVSRIRCE